jgi:hypothetical protein
MKISSSNLPGSPKPVENGNLFSTTHASTSLRHRGVQISQQNQPFERGSVRFGSSTLHTSEAVVRNLSRGDDPSRFCMGTKRAL